MLLIEWTSEGGSLIRISTDYIALDKQWYGYVDSLSSIKFQTTKKYGGYAKPSFSDLTLTPKMFESSWPPPKTAAVKLIQTETTEAAGIVIFDGTAQRANYDRYGVKYTLHQPEFDATLVEEASTEYTTGDGDTVASVIAELCGASILDLTYDGSEARASSPNVDYTITSDIQAIDFISELAAFFTHGFKIIEGTLYLYDMLESTTPIVLTEFDVQPCSYKDGQPISLITCGDDSVAGPNPNGDEVSISTSYAATGGDTEDALGDIKTMLESDVAVIKAKIDDDKPTVLEYMELTDESTIGTTTTSARVMSVVYNYNTLDMQIEAYGEIT